MMGYGYENAAGDRISALIDMINGGGPGRSGGTFEGGGILSLLANAVAKPYGSVRERPGHTPMGAAAPQMDVLLPVTTEAVETMDLPPMDERASLPGLAESSLTPPPYRRRGASAEEGYRGAIFRPTFSPAATGGRRFTAEDRALLPTLHPDLAALFSETKLGELLSPQQAMFLDIARVGSPEPQDPLVPAPTGIETVRDTAYDYLGDPTFFTPDQLDAMSPRVRAMAEEHNMRASEVFRVPAAGPAGTDEPIRVPYLGTVFNVFPKTGRVIVEYPVANAEKGYFAAAGDELRPGTQYYYDVMELVKRGR